MRKTLTCAAAGWITLLALASGARGQVGWDSPMFTPPTNPVGLGVYLVDPSPGRGIGLMATWRGTEGPGSLGFRAGIAEDRTEDLSLFGGMDISGDLRRGSDEFPLDLVWVAGAGLGVGHYTLLSFPLGVSLGKDFDAEGVWFNPYLTPRLVLDAWLGNHRRRNDMDVSLALDFGIDLAVDPGWAMRFGATLGERSAIGLGASFRVR
jgi:hypothetical protein